MKIHKEGFRIIIISAFILAVVNFFLIRFLAEFEYIVYLIVTGSVFLFYIILQFFRMPNREKTISEDTVISAADGEIVVIEKVFEKEYFKDERIQISVFMSLWNVHMNVYPVSGTISYCKYHPGKYLLARNPKSSVENERTSVVVENRQKIEILFRQIAGIVARRVKFYGKQGDFIEQSSECGFIKFGSRLDVFIPLDATINVKIGDKVKGGQSILAYI